jgi:hypothetical protein
MEFVRLSEPPAELVVDVVGTTDVDRVCDLARGDDVDFDDTRRVELPVKEDADQEPPGLNRDERERGVSGQDDDALQRFDLDTGRHRPDQPVVRRSHARGAAGEVRVYIDGVMRVELVFVGETSPAARTTPTHTDSLWDHRQPGVLTAVTRSHCPLGARAAMVPTEHNNAPGSGPTAQVEDVSLVPSGARTTVSAGHFNDAFSMDIDGQARVAISGTSLARGGVLAIAGCRERVRSGM